MKNNISVFTVVILYVALLCCGCRGRATQTNTVSQGQQPETGQVTNTESARPVEPVQYSYNIKAVWPHDPTSYTQGLFWHDGKLWESTGQYGESQIMEVDLRTGKASRARSLESRFFGEGAAILEGKIYQLTWVNGFCLVYDAVSLEQTGTFRYSGQGWGLTTDGRWLYMSDGSSVIRRIDPKDFSEVGTVEVRMRRRKVDNINELEWIDGKIWANVYLTDSIIIIDPETGAVEGVIDLQDILPQSDRTPMTDVLNGIAWDPETGRIFVTGKNWNKLFEIEIKKK